MANTNLMDIAAEYREAFEKMTDLDVPQEVMDDTLEGLKGPLEIRGANIVKWAEMQDAYAAAIKARAKMMNDRAKALEAKAERARQFLFNAMKLAKISLIETPEVKIRVKGGAWKCIIDAESQVPPEYKRFPDPPAPEIDKRKILEDLAAGKELTFAHREQGFFLEIK